MNNKNWTQGIEKMLFPVVLIVLWEIVFRFGWINPLFIPSPISIITAFSKNLTSLFFYENIGMTLYRVITAFLISISIGVPIGMLMGYYKKVYDSLEFIVEFFRSIPATALFPLFLLFLGANEASNIACAVFGCSLIILINTMAGVRFANKLRLQSAKIYKAKGYKLFRHVIFPEALAEILTGFRIGLSICFIIIVLVEMFIGTNMGLGRMIIDSQQVYEIPLMYVAIMITGLIGFLGNKIIVLLERKILHYSGR